MSLYVYVVSAVWTMHIVFAFNKVIIILFYLVVLQLIAVGLKNVT